MLQSMDIRERLDFDPSAGTVIRTPPGTGYGYWVGGHKVFRDPADGTFWLFSRERTPLERGRGAVASVSRSEDGVAFTDVWSVTKDELAATSIEVGQVVRVDDEWRCYLSYEFAPTGEWRIDVIRGSDPSRFSAQSRRTVLNPSDYGLAWIKDPFLVRRGDEWWLYANAPARTRAVDDDGTIRAVARDATVVSGSGDGLVFPMVRYVFEASGDDSWHGRRARLNSVFPWGDGWAATFDGGRTSYDNYEEWAGLATSPDGLRFDRVETDGPWVRSPHGCVRYVYVQPVDDHHLVYYEYTRRDGSHDLRVARVR